MEVTVKALTPIRERFEEIRNSEELIRILREGAGKADAIAKETIERVKGNFGLGL